MSFRSVRALVSALSLTSCLVAGGLADLAFAEDEMVGDRPDFTESARTVESGRIQLEAGATFSDFESAGEEVSYGEALLRIGIAEALEFRAGLGSWVDIDTGGGDVNGFDDVSIGLKWRLGPVAPVIDNVALLVGTSLPWGDRDLAERAWQPGATLAAEWALAEGLSLGANVGWTYARSDGERFGQARASASLGIALTERIGGFVEAFAFDEESPGGSLASYADAGIVYSVHDNLALDARLGVGLGPAETDFFAGVGVVARF